MNKEKLFAEFDRICNESFISENKGIKSGMVLDPTKSVNWNIEESARREALCEIERRNFNKNKRLRTESIEKALIIDLAESNDIPVDKASILWKYA